MIEKLDRHIKIEENGVRISCPPTQADCIDKINELVYAVNVLQAQVAILEEHAHPTAKTEPTDPYAEQRKWIGKLCKCWDSDINDDVWGILQDIKDNKTEKYYMYGIGYEHCEPVKPDDDIIFKGEYFNKWIDISIQAIKNKDQIRVLTEQELANHQATMDQLKGLK